MKRTGSEALAKVWEIEFASADDKCSVEIGMNQDRLFLHATPSYLYPDTGQDASGEEQGLNVGSLLEQNTEISS